ncbi:hypothetical protein BDB00DRAFT_785933 [Zychaea mexicana]|uniref:uncharacterized protein n=1 Tax=Zychaea mexicana TaxID=64656 RepID=UPI0022FEEBF8|nr:uncharacterized protein BDB00DRAFT_785933 [Zychaea mexicana]KAI9495990.1 hypothetical protein BDB00DRAFT_785933 [Zychaea mexicana]
MFEWVYGNNNNNNKKEDHQHDCCISIPEYGKEDDAYSSFYKNNNNSCGSTINRYGPLGSTLSSAASTTSTVKADSGSHVQVFLVKFAKTLVAAGAPSHRLDHCVQLLMQKLNIRAQIGYVPGYLIVSFGDPESLGSAAQLVTVTTGLDLSRFCRTYRLFESVLCDDITIREATLALDHIAQGPCLYPWWLTWIGYGLASSASMPLFFAGGFVDMAFGFWWGIVVAGGVVHLSARVTRFASIFDVVMSALIGFLSAAVASRLSISCFYALSIGGVVMLLPGYATLTALLEIGSGAVASGTLKLTTTLVYSLLIGFGLAIGASTHQLIFPSLALVSSDDICESNALSSRLYDILFVPVFAAGQLIILRARWNKYPIMLLLAAVSHSLHRVCLSHFVVYPHVATVLASLAVALVSNLYARLTSTVGFVDMLMGLLFLVPGSVGVSSSLDTFGQALQTSDPMTEMSIILNAGQQGLIFSSHMMVIAVSVSVGLVLAAILLYPVRKVLDCKRKKSPYHTKDWVGDITF